MYYVPMYDPISGKMIFVEEEKLKKAQGEIGNLQYSETSLEAFYKQLGIEKPELDFTMHRELTIEEKMLQAMATVKLTEEAHKRAEKKLAEAREAYEKLEQEFYKACKKANELKES